MPKQRIYIFDSDAAASLVTQRGLQALLGETVNVMISPTADAAWLACANDNVDLLIIDPGAPAIVLQPWFARCVPIAPIFQ